MADDKIRIMIVDDVVESQKNLARLLSFEPDMDVVGFASSGREAIETVETHNPDVILMDINMQDMDGLSATEIITKKVACSVIMISVQSDPDYMRRAMRSGAVDFLAKPPSADELYATVRSAYQRRPKAFTPAEPAQSAAARPKVSGRVIVLYSPQGGAGVTTLSVNLAAGLMGDEKNSILVDANLQFGDVVVHLDKPNERNLVDLAQAADILDDELINQVVITHDSGLNVLAAPKRPEEAELVPSGSLVKVVNFLAEKYNYVVVDTSLHLDEVTLSLFEAADVVMLVGLPMIPAAKNLRVVLDLLAQLDLNMSKFLFVVNRVPTDRKSGALNPEDVASLLKLELASAIPNAEKAMYDALNRGVPAIVNTRSSPGRELRELVEKIRVKADGGDRVDEEEEASENKQPGLLGGIFGN